MALTTAQERAATLFATGQRNPEVARQLGIRPETASRWRARADVQARINQLLTEARQDTLERLQAAGGLAVDVLIEALQGGHGSGFSSAERLRAATSARCWKNSITN